MFIMDVPYVEAGGAPVIVVQTAESRLPVDFILKACSSTIHTAEPRSAFRVIDPASLLIIYFQNHQVYHAVNIADIKTTLLEGAKHGNLFSAVDNDGRTTYRYDPEPDFYGDDQAIFLAEYGDKRYKIILEIKVIKEKDYDDRVDYCPKPVLIKAPTPGANDSGISSDYEMTSAVKLDGPHGEDLGQGNATGFTLDDDAYGWYIDYTPYLNE